MAYKVREKHLQPVICNMQLYPSAGKKTRAELHN